MAPADPHSRGRRVQDLFDRIPGGSAAIAVWLGATVAAGVLIGHRAARIEYLGLAHAVEYEVSAAQEGRLAQVLVGLYDQVGAGDMVALLDDAVLSASLDVASAELRGIEAELARARILSGAGGSGDQLAARGDLRRFEIDVEDRKLEELELTVAIESDRIEEQRLLMRAERARALHKQGIVSQEEYDDARLQHAALARRIEESLLALATVRLELTAADERRREFLGRVGALTEEIESVLAPLEASVAAQAHRVEEVRAQREGLVLRSPVAGRVLSVAGRPGQSVIVGEPVAVIVPTVVDQVLAYIPEQDAGRLRERDRVLVAADRDPSRVAESIVLRISPAVEPMPERLWRNLRMPEYGHPFVVTLAQPLDLTPGERVHVRVLPSGS